MTNLPNLKLVDIHGQLFTLWPSESDQETIIPKDFDRGKYEDDKSRQSHHKKNKDIIQILKDHINSDHYQRYLSRLAKINEYRMYHNQ